MLTEKLTIAVDARWIYEKLSGIGRVTKNLLYHLPRVDWQDRFVFIFDNEIRMASISEECGFAQFNNVEVLNVNFGIFSLKNQILLPRLLKNNDIDVFHSTNFMLPLRHCTAKKVVTIHDLIPLVFPYFTPKSKKRRFFFLYRYIMKKTMKTADVIVADSENTKRDIIRFYPGTSGKITVIGCGIEEKYFVSKKRPCDFLHKKFRINGRIIITAGRADPYKNTLGLVKAFKILNSNPRYDDVHLFIIGDDDPRYPETKTYVNDNGLSGRVIFTGYLKEDELPLAYASADIMVHPSMYEGFGLPPLEAMAAGTPVISSNTSSLPEVLGDSAVYIQPGDVDEMARMIIELLEDDTLRKNLSAKGIDNARRFSWEDVARKTVEVYRGIASL